MAPHFMAQNGKVQESGVKGEAMEGTLLHDATRTNSLHPDNIPT